MSEKCSCGNGNRQERFKELAPTLKKYAAVPGSLITILQKTQEIYGYLSPDAINYIADETGIKPAKIYGVATFYAQFRMEPIGKYLIMLCKGTACHVNGADVIEESICEHLGIGDGGNNGRRNFYVEQCGMSRMLLTGPGNDGKKC